MHTYPPSRTSRPLKIIFVAPFGLRHKTTVWARTLPIAQELVAAGHTATILVPPWDSPEDAGKVETHEGVRVVQVNVKDGVLFTVRRLLSAIAEAQPDIVHIVKPRAHAGIVQWWLWQQRRRHLYKIVLDVDDWEQAWSPFNRYGWFTAHFLDWQEEWGIRHADAITAASRWLEHKINAVAPAIPALYLPNGVNPLTSHAHPAPTRATDRPRILYFSRFIEVLPEWLHDFWKVMLQRVPGAELTVAGAPVQPWIAPHFHRALEALPQVEWLGYVPGTALPALYANATCAIFPAMPTPLLQAKCSVRLATTLLHGVPVVASAVGEHVNYGADGAAVLVPAGATPAAFADAVAACIQHADQDETARQAATARMLTRYRWSRLTAPLPAFYATLLGQR